MSIEAASSVSRDVPRTCLSFAEQVFEPLVSGALYWPATETLIVADLHLEKMSSFAARGSLLPPYDTRLTLKRLGADMAEVQAKRVICLGDSFHRDEGVSTLGDTERTALMSLAGRVEFLWISGNHDPSPHALPGKCVSEHEETGILFTHAPKKTDRPLMAGHLHPAARVAMRGRSARRPCFVHDDLLAILPAFGSSTGSLNILSPAFAGLLRFSQLRVVMLGRETLYSVNKAHLVAG